MPSIAYGYVTDSVVRIRKRADYVGSKGAADVIRELGYPSKEALRMWHRDWLEERRTGIPSSRGEHYSRYTDGQRRAAVEHYLTHGRLCLFNGIVAG